MIKKERTQKTELRTEWKRKVIYKKQHNWQKTEKRERIQTRSRGSIEKNRKDRKRIEETRKERRKTKSENRSIIGFLSEKEDA